MAKTKFIFGIIVLCLLTITTGFAKDAGGKKATANPIVSLNNQLYDEITSVLNLPVYLAFEDKNIKGEAYVTMKVNEEGKLVIVNIYGENETLNRYIKSKISSRNLWTPQKYSNQYLRYRIQIK